MADIDEFKQSRTLKAADIPEDGVQVTITGIEKDTENRYDGKPSIFFAEVEKPLVVNATNRNRIAVMHGRDYTKWTGQQITLVVEDVEFKGEYVPSIRVKVIRDRKVQVPLGENPAEGLDDEVPF